MPEKEADKRCSIEVETKLAGFTKIHVTASTEEKTLKLFKDVRKEIEK